MPQAEETLIMSETKPAVHPETRTWVEMPSVPAEADSRDDSIEYSLREIRF